MCVDSLQCQKLYGLSLTLCRWLRLFERNNCLASRVSLFNVTLAWLETINASLVTTSTKIQSKKYVSSVQATYAQPFQKWQCHRIVVILFSNCLSYNENRIMCCCCKLWKILKVRMICPSTMQSASGNTMKPSISYQRAVLKNLKFVREEYRYKSFFNLPNCTWGILALPEWKTKKILFKAHANSSWLWNELWSVCA